MYSRRSGFLRRYDSSRLTRNGSTQYVRDLNNCGVPPYTINSGMISHAQNILSSTGNGYIINPVRNRRYAGRSIPKTTNFPPADTVRVTDNVNVSQINIPINSSSTDPNYPLLVDKDNVTFELNMPSLSMTENNWRNGFEVNYQQNFVYNNSVPWIRSLRYVFVPMENTYATNTQPAFNCDINFNNDEDPTKFTVMNSSTDFLVFYFLDEQYNPYELEEIPSTIPFKDEFPMEFVEEVQGVDNPDPTYFITEDDTIRTSREFPDNFNHYPISLTTNPSNEGEANVFISFPSVKITKDNDKYTLESYIEHGLGDHVSSPLPIQFTLKGYYADITN